MSEPALLVIDTHAAACGALLRRGGVGDICRVEDIGRGHDRRLAPLVRDLLAEAGLSPRQLTKIGVCVGPGSFTGVRVGVAFARGLSLALRIPVVGVNALDALGWALRDAPMSAAVHDAKRGELVWRVYQHGTPSGEPCLQAVDEIAPAFSNLAGDVVAPLQLAGTGAALIPNASGVDSGHRIPSLQMLADLAEGSDADAHPARPFHHRPPDATPSQI